MMEMAKLCACTQVAVEVVATSAFKVGRQCFAKAFKTGYPVTIF